MENSRVIISVIVPTYHRNDLLHKCLTCLAPSQQHLDDSRYEVIVSDDGRKTTAEQMVRDEFPWVKWVAGPRKGPAANRNNGVNHAHGEWLAFTDDDCLPKPEWLAAFASAIHTGIDVYEGKTTCEVGIHSPLEGAPVNETGGWLWSCNMMTKKVVFHLVGGFDESFPKPHLEDVDFRRRLLSCGYQFSFVDAAVVDHPPRSVLRGRKRSMMAESEILFWYKCGNTKLYSPLFLYRTIRGRVNDIKKHPFNRNFLLAILSLLEEFFYLIINLPSWEKKYRAKYR